MYIHQHPSPNCGPRRNGLRPSLVVVHYTAMASAEAAIERLCDPAAEVSAHYVIGRRGEITQLVDEEMRAWHAGAGEWHGQDDVNSRSIGIELDNGGTYPFAEPQMASLEWLLPRILDRWGIGPEGVIGHSDMAPGRKFDPGAHFDWARLARQGLAATLPAGKTAADAGYTAPASDADRAVAVQLRWGTDPRTKGFL
ncbi:N-acetylmuramoyl-L-alanine amidase [Ascidiaceihabitans sp.]|uniref:N-acetylmuramoyl-L-alanine amidase n=1 Tax=Ascidiaceihabitans sp. TaxID=1872644 RepID=UPI003297630B